VAQRDRPVVQFSYDQDLAVVKSVSEQKPAEAGAGGEQAIAILDVQLHFVVANPAFGALLGRPPQELVGQPLRAFGEHPVGRGIAQLPFSQLEGAVRQLLWTDDERCLALVLSVGWMPAAEKVFVLAVMSASQPGSVAPFHAVEAVHGQPGEGLWPCAVEGLHALLSLGGANHPLERLLDVVYAQAYRLLGISGMAVLWGSGEDTAQLQPLYVQGSSGCGPLDPLLWLQLQAQGQPVELPAVETAAGPVRRLAVPLLFGGELQGVLVFDKSGGCQLPTEESQSLLSWLADQVLIAYGADQLQKKAKTAAALQERERLARELHDAATQSIYSLTLFAEAVRRQAAEGRIEQTQTYLQQLSDAARQALRELRLLLYELQPARLEQVGLVEALRQRLEAVELHTGIQAHLVVDRPLHLPAVVEEGLYRICQEALNNTLKHALATEVTVQLFCAERAVHLSVEDNGVGFDVHDLRVLNGVGIRTIRERVRLMNANFSIVAAPQQGAHLHVWLAVPAAAAAYGEDPADLSVERGATWPK